ncbi:MAG: response regulator [Coraliomargarita sp.]
MPDTPKEYLDILLLEDNAADADLVGEYLELSKLNCDLVKVQRLAEGLQLLKKTSFDVVLLDLSLPDSRGLETLEKLAEAVDHEVIIVLTGADDEQLSLDTLKRGAQDYLFKDKLSVEVLARSIRYSLERTAMIKRIEAHNRETKHREALLQRVFDANIDAMLILTDESEIKFLNPAAGHLLDADPKALVGEIFPFSVESGQQTELEIPGPVDTNRLVELHAVDLVWKGQSSMLVVLRDITESRAAQQALNLEKRHLNVIFDAIADAVIVSNAGGLVERINPEAERLIGMPNEAACGKPLNEVLKLKNPESGKVIEDPSKVFLSAKSHAPAEEWDCPLLHNDGGETVVNVQMRRIEESAPQGNVIVFRDMTQHKEREDGLYRAEKMQSISQLVGGIAHDFNNMLTAVLGNISVARIGLGEDHAEADKLLSAEKAALQARSLTQQLLTFSKGGEPITEATTIDQLVQDCAQFLLRGSNVKCELYKDESLHAVEVDRGQIAQVVNNLIINANQAMPAGGILNVSLRNVEIAADELPSLAAGHYVCISVKDNGSGIDPQDINRIFDPYFTTKDEGNGLGLASCFSIIRNHHGVILVDSTLGEGSEFRVYLPQAEEPAAEVSEETVENGEEASDQIHHGSGRILVMDDMEAMMMVAGEILGMLGYDVTLTADGEEAIEVYKHAKESGDPFLACVFDLTVPGGMGGEEACQLLREYDPDMIAIASSGYTTSNAMSDFKSAGFDAVVPKPYRIKEMSTALHELLS